MQTCCDSVRGQFLCPLCKTFCNACLPVYPVVAADTPAPKDSTVPRFDPDRFMSALSSVANQKITSLPSAHCSVLKLAQDTFARWSWKLFDVAASRNDGRSSTPLAHATLRLLDGHDNMAASAHFLLGQCQACVRDTVLPQGRRLRDLMQSRFTALVESGKWSTDMSQCFLMSNFLRAFLEAWSALVHTEQSQLLFEACANLRVGVVLQVCMSTDANGRVVCCN